MYQTMNGWTKEKMINHIKANFKGKSVNSGDECLYRGPEGTKCAVGMFIPDEKYDPILENKWVKSPIVAKILEDIKPISLEGLAELQEVHDVAYHTKCLSDMIKWIENNVSDS